MWSLWEFVAFSDASGAPTDLQCIGFDIAHAQDTEEALRQSEKRFAIAFRTSPVPSARLAIRMS
jgi:PAS domain-containing protein